MQPQPTVFLVEGNHTIQRALAEVVASAGFQVETYPSAEAFLEDYEPQMPGCIVLELRLPKMSGPGLQEELLARGWLIPLVFVSSFGTLAVVTQIMKAGAVYFLETPVEPNGLIACIQEALELDRQTRDNQTERAKIESRLAQLTAREGEILQHVIEGKSSKEIAAALHLSPNTVQLHRAHIRQKLGCRNVADLMRMVLRAR